MATQGQTFQNSIKVSTNFGLAGAKPLDARSTVKTLADLESYDMTIVYEGMPVYVEEVNRYYIYSKGSFNPVQLTASATSDIDFSGPLDAITAKLKNALTIPAGSTATTQTITDNSQNIATTQFVHQLINSKLAAADAMTYKGVIAGGTNLPAGNAGDFYKVSSAGTISGLKVHIGDIFICKTDNTAANTAANWDLICVSSADGTIAGPSVSVVNNIPVFGSTTGTSVIDSGVPVFKIGKIMLDAADDAGYAADKIVGATTTESNDYPVKVTKANGKLSLSVVINKIDGGYYDE